MVKKIFIIFYRLTVHKIPVGMFIKILMEENVRSYRYDCVVIGGGASGMMAAVTAAQNGAKTAIIEHTKDLEARFYLQVMANAILQITRWMQHVSRMKIRILL